MRKHCIAANCDFRQQIHAIARQKKDGKTVFGSLENFARICRILTYSIKWRSKSLKKNKFGISETAHLVWLSSRKRMDKSSKIANDLCAKQSFRSIRAVTAHGDARTSDERSYEWGIKNSQINGRWPGEYGGQGVIPSKVQVHDYMFFRKYGSTKVRKYFRSVYFRPEVRKYLYFRTVIVLPEVHVLYLSVYSCTHNGVPSKIFSYTYTYAYRVVTALRTSTIFNFQHILPLELVYCPRTSALERGWLARVVPIEFLTISKLDEDFRENDDTRT